jgi:hypothetical protein
MFLYQSACLRNGVTLGCFFKWNKTARQLAALGFNSMPFFMRCLDWFSRFSRYGAKRMYVCMYVCGLGKVSPKPALRGENNTSLSLVKLMGLGASYVVMEKGYPE